ncbi:hypothetical protein MHEI_15280 [Mycobacterium heidelbergense]|nr:hypothetical protein MHEI_15280 [Mycobacterium heidelbergense]
MAAGVSTIGAVARPPDDSDDPPTRFEPAESPDPFDEETEPTAWYRKPVGLIAWLVAVLILIALIVYGIIELIQGDQGTTHAPSTTPPTTTATTTTPPPSTTTTVTPPTSSAVEPPAQQPTQQQPTQQQPTHHHHLPPLPSVITVPGVPTAITLPPGLP